MKIQKNNFAYDRISCGYYTIGHGPDHVLVLHGWGSSWQSWSKFFQLVDREKFTWYFIEMPGFGDSGNPHKGWAVDDYVEFISKFVASFDVEPKFFLGHSFGCRVGIKWLSQTQNPFEKAVFVGAAGLKPKLSIQKRLIKWLGPKFKILSKVPVIKSFHRLAQKIVYRLVGASDYEKLEGTMKKTFNLVIEENLEPYLSKIKIPVKLIWGKGDTYTPLWMGRKMEGIIPNSDLVILENARHGIHLQAPEQLADLSQKFFLN